MVHYAGFWNPNITDLIAQLWDLIETSSFRKNIKRIKDFKENDEDYNNKNDTYDKNNKEDNNKNDTYNKDDKDNNKDYNSEKVKHLIFR